MAEAAPTRGKRRPWMRIIAVVLLCVVGAGVMTLVLRRRLLARHMVQWGLEQWALGPVSLDVTRFDATALELAHVRIGAGDELTVDLVEIRHSVAGLLGLRLDALRITGIRLRGTVDDSGLSFGVLDSFLDASDEPAEPLSALPISHVVIEDARMHLETSSGAVETQIAAELNAAPTGRIDGHVTFTAGSPFGDARGRLDLSGTPDELEGIAAIDYVADEGTGAFEISFAPHITYSGGVFEVDLPGVPFSLGSSAAGAPFRIEGEIPHLHLTGARIESDGGSIRLPGYALEADRFALSATLDSVTHLPVGRLRVERIHDARTPARLPELALDAHVTTQESGLAYEITLADAQQRAVIRTTGSHDVGNGTGSGTFRLEPLVFQANGMQPGDLVPAWRDLLTNVTGSIEAVGSIAWGGAAPTGGIDLAIRELSFSSDLADVERVNATLHIDGPWPPSMPPGQLASIGRIDFGLELTNGLIAYRLHPDRTLVLESATWALAGGTIHTSGRFHPEAPTYELLLAVADIDLAQLLERIALEGLSGTGRLGGTIPIVMGRDAIEIRDGTLAATGRGRVRYQPGAGVKTSTRGQAGADVLLEVLDNFHYERLELTLDGDTSGTVDLRIHLAGANPDYQDGHPVEFTLNVESRLADLLRKGVAAYKIPRVIEERLLKFSDGQP